MVQFPAIPEELQEEVEDGVFVPSPEWGGWAMEHLVEPDGAFTNPRHVHLLDMRIGWLLTNIRYVSRGRLVGGRAEMGSAPPGMFGWNRCRWEHQLREWFGPIPEFVITLFAPYMARARPMEVCALIDHELCHCAQKTDDHGNPRFHQATGEPLAAIVAHDVEEFVEVVARWGAGAARGVEAMVEAASRPPMFGEADLSEVACGTCKRKAA